MAQKRGVIGTDDLERDLTQRIQRRFEANNPFSPANIAADEERQRKEAAAVQTPTPQTTPQAEGGRGVLADTALQVVGGARDAASEMLRFVDSAGNWLGEHVPLIKKLDEMGPHITVNDFPEVPAAASRGTEFVRGVSRFLTGFAIGGKAAKALGITGAVAKGLAAGAFADVVTTSPDVPTIGNLIEDLVGEAPDDLKGTLLDYITIRGDDTEGEKRLKHGLEGMGLGLLTEGVFRAAKALRAAVKTTGVTGAVDDVAETAAENVSRETIPAPTESPAGQALPKTSPEAPSSQAAPPVVTEETLASMHVKAQAAIVPDELADLPNRFKAAVDRQRRGTRSIPQAIEEAQAAFPPEGRMLLSDVKAILPGSTMNDSQVVALVQTVSDVASKTQDFARGVLDGTVDEGKFVDQLTTLFEIAEPARLGVEAEAGRTLRILGDPIVGQRDFIQQFTEAVRKGLDGRTMNDVAKMFAEMKSLPEMLQIARNLQKPGWWDLFTEVRVNGLLSGPRTLAANGISNPAALAENIFERWTASTFNSGGAIAPGEASAMLTGITESWTDSMRLAAKAFRGEMPDMVGGSIKLEGRFAGEPVFATVIRSKLGDFGGWLDTVEAVINSPGRALVATDEFFKSIAFQAEVHALARREGWFTAKRELGDVAYDVLASRAREIERSLLKDPPPFIKEAAKDFSLYTTFNRSVHGRTAEAISAFTQTPVGGFIIPFHRTPQNIFKFTLERTPAAKLLPSVKRALASAGSVERELALARIYTGSAMMSAFGLLAYNGFVTGGGPTDPDLQRTLKQTGWQPYAVKIGNVWIGYNRLEPLGSIIGMAADAVALSGYLPNEEKESLLSGMVVSLYKNLGSKTFLRGIAMAIDAISDPDTNAFNSAQSTLASAVPFSSAIRTVKNVVDPSIRSDSQGWFKILDDARFGIGLESDRDLFGNKILLPVGLGPTLMGRLAGMLIPFAVTTDTSNAVTQQLVDMKFATSPLRPKIGDIDLTPKQFTRYQELAGKGMMAAIARAMQKPGFETQLAELKNEDVHRAVDEQRAMVRERFLQEEADIRKQQFLKDREREQRVLGTTPEDQEKARQRRQELGRIAIGIAR